MSLGTNDLSKAMEVAGAGLVTYGNDINDMISLVTAGTEIMVGRSQQVARGLNMIASRVVKNEDALKEYGISIYDTNGSLRSTYDILKDLAPIWKTMGDAQRVALGDTLAGTNQYKVLAAVMGNFDSALKAHEVALNSSGSASRENAKAIGSLAGHLNQLKAQFEALANNVISSQFVKSLLDAGTAILKFANSDLGQAVIKMAAVTLGFKAFASVGSKLVSSVLPLLKDGLMGILALFQNLSMNAGKFLGTALDGIAESISSINPATLILVGVTLATIVEKTFSAEAQFDRLNQKFEQSKTELESLQAEYDSLNTKSNLTQAEEARLRLLQSQLQTLKEQTAEYAKQAAQKYSETGATVVGGGEGIGGGIGAGAVEVETAGARAKRALEDWSNATKEAKESANEYAELLYEEKDALNAVGEQLDEEAQAFLDAYEQVVPVIENSQTSIDNIASSIENYSDRVYALIDAQNELDATHQISQQTAENLLALYPELEGQIIHLADGYYIEDEALRNLMQSELTQSGSVTDQIYASVKTLLSSEQAKAIAYNGTTKSLKNQIAAQIEYIKATQATMRLQLEAYRGTPQFAAASAAASRALAQSSSEMSKLQAAYSNVSALESVTDNLTSSVKRYASSVAGSGGSVGATKSATSATKSNTSATKANTDAQEAAKKAHDELVDSLKDVADAYKTAAKYMASQIEIEINTLEKRKDAIEESYDAQIKAIQDANDAIEEQMELEKAQQALEEAKKKRQLVFTGGQFQYVEDAKAIAEAQENLNNVVRQQEMEQQVQNLENARDAELRAIDDQIAGWEKYKEQWESLADSYQEQQDKLIAQQVLGIKLEGDNWKQRLTNAQAFVDQYKKIMAQLDVLEGSDTSTPQSAKTVLNQAKNLGTKGFANGTTSTPAGIYKVGEAGSELMVGRGNGVIPHNLTENLMRLGQFSPSEWVNSLKGTLADRNQTVVQQFGDISLPNVSNASQFVEQLKQFKNYAVQATSRR